MSWWRKPYESRYPYSASGRMAGQPGSVPMPDPLELLAFLACASSTLRLGTAIVVAPLHSPAVLAKRVATVDRLSGGRVELGLGIGWQREEYAAVGAAFDHRGSRLEECIEAMRALWADHPASYEGQYVSFSRVFSEPPPEKGRVPILLGGHSDAGRRTGGPHGRRLVSVHHHGRGVHREGGRRAGGRRGERP